MFLKIALSPSVDGDKRIKTSKISVQSNVRYTLKVCHFESRKESLQLKLNPNRKNKKQKNLMVCVAVR